LSEEKILINTGTGISKVFLRKEVDDIKLMLDELPDCLTKDQLIRALKHSGERIEALLKLAGGY
jgi:hypothetical protein